MVLEGFFQEEDVVAWIAVQEGYPGAGIGGDHFLFRLRAA